MPYYYCCYQHHHHSPSPTIHQPTRSPSLKSCTACQCPRRFSWRSPTLHSFSLQLVIKGNKNDTQIGLFGDVVLFVDILGYGDYRCCSRINLVGNFVLLVQFLGTPSNRVCNIDCLCEDLVEDLLVLVFCFSVNKGINALLKCTDPFALLMFAPAADAVAPAAPSPPSLIASTLILVPSTTALSNNTAVLAPLSVSNTMMAWDKVLLS